MTRWLATSSHWAEEDRGRRPWRGRGRETDSAAREPLGGYREAVWTSDVRRGRSRGETLWERVRGGMARRRGGPGDLWCECGPRCSEGIPDPPVDPQLRRGSSLYQFHTSIKTTRSRATVPVFDAAASGTAGGCTVCVSRSRGGFVSRDGPLRTSSRVSDGSVQVLEPFRSHGPGRQVETTTIGLTKGGRDGPTLRTPGLLTLISVRRGCTVTMWASPTSSRRIPTPSAHDDSR